MIAWLPHRAQPTAPHIMPAARPVELARRQLRAWSVFIWQVRSSRKGAVQGAARRSGHLPEQAVQRRNVPFLLEPCGQPREPVACGVAAPCRSPATSRRRAWHPTGSRGCALAK